MNIQHCRIGRNPSNDLVINDRAAEDFHAVIMLNEDNLIFIEDQNSRYGTMVNGERISKVQLFPGDEVQIGFSRIDWESRTSFQPSLNEIEVIPNLSVPIKRTSPNNSALSHARPNGDLDHLNKSDATKELANTLIENELQMDRIDNTKMHDEKSEIVDSINDVTIPSDDHFFEVPIDSQTVEEIEDFNESENNQETLIITNQSVYLPIKESINEKVNLNNDGTSENDSIENLSLDLNQKNQPIEPTIVIDNQLNEPNIESKNSDELNTISTPINLDNNDAVKKQEDIIIDSSKTISPQKKSNLLHKDSIQIILAIILICLFLAAGWLIGQAS